MLIHDIQGLAIAAWEWVYALDQKMMAAFVVGGFFILSWAWMRLRKTFKPGEKLPPVKKKARPLPKPRDRWGR